MKRHSSPLQPTPPMAQAKRRRAYSENMTTALGYGAWTLTHALLLGPPGHSGTASLAHASLSEQAETLNAIIHAEQFEVLSGEAFVSAAVALAAALLYYLYHVRKAPDKAELYKIRAINLGRQIAEIFISITLAQTFAGILLHLLDLVPAGGPLLHIALSVSMAVLAGLFRVALAVALDNGLYGTPYDASGRLGGLRSDSSAKEMAYAYIGLFTRTFVAMLALYWTTYSLGLIPGFNALSSVEQTAATSGTITTAGLGVGGMRYAWHRYTMNKATTEEITTTDAQMDSAQYLQPAKC